MRKAFRLVTLLAAVALVLAACGSSASGSAPASGIPASETGGSFASPLGTPSAAAATASTPTETGVPGATVPPPTASPAPPDAVASDRVGGATSGTGAGANDWPVYHLDAQRTGYLASFPSYRGPLAVAWTAKLDGAVYAEPLVVHSRVIVATEGDSVYSLDPASGSVVWTRKLGTPVSRSSLPCGNIDPLGITSTPVYDAATGSLFVVAEVSGPKHVMFALDAATGAVRWSRSVDLPGDDPTTHQQRAALALANGYVYAGFGGLAGDCGQYTGKVVGVPTSGSGSTIAYRVPVQREGAVWATGGPVIDTAGNLYVSTGNGSSTTKFDGSDSVVELSPTLQQTSIFAPVGWAQDNARDADLGSSTPTLLPAGFVFIAGKAGIGYVLRQGNLGGIGGQVFSKSVCAPFGGTASLGSSVFLPCTNGVTRVTVTPGGQFAEDWHTTSGANGPPVIGGKTVWTVKTSAGTLYALDLTTGAVQGSLTIGPVPHFATPTLWQSQVLVGTMSGVVAVRV